MSDPRADIDRRPDGPDVKAETWFALAIASMIISAVIAAFVAAWVFGATEAAGMVQRAQSFTPFGAALLAIVTFFTVAWRGVLNTRQLEHQAAQLELQNSQLAHQATQIDLQTRQFELQTKQLELQTRQVEQQTRANDSSDQANLARLLQEGAKLLGEKEKEPQLLGGIVTLETLVIGQNSFSLSAMNLLLDFVQRSYNIDSHKSAVLAARLVLARGAKTGVRASFISEFKTEDDDHVWLGVKGAARIEYSGGTVDSQTYSDTDGRGWFSNARVIQCKIVDDKPGFFRCKFRQCDFSGIKMNRLIGGSFTDCLFSGAEFSEGFDFSNMVVGNKYQKGQPPVGGGGRWQGVIEEVDEAPLWSRTYSFNRPGDLAHI